MLKFFQALFLKMIGGTRNERLVRARMRFVQEQVNPLEERMRGLTQEQMLELSHELRTRLSQGASRDEVKPEAFALIREASRRARSHRQFDVQLVAGMVLDEGSIAEEATGEGKTIACYPAIYLAVLEGKHVHVVTTNDYLVQRDAEFALPIFEMLGCSVGFIVAQMPNDKRKQAYACDVTYGTNSEFGFDYLRDNMKLSVSEQVQGSLDYAIIDEVDNILIDEARTPLIISGPARGNTDKFRKADAVAREMISRNRAYDRLHRGVENLKLEVKALEGEAGKERDNDALKKKLEQKSRELETRERELESTPSLYKVELDKKSAHMTDEGVVVAQDIAGIGSFYVGANMEWPHLMDQALRAHLVFEKDKDYVVQNDEVVIVDEFTGRLMEGREWSDGLHQAVAAKERVRIKQQNQTLATITLQNYFKLYGKLAGMTGTAITEANEFMKIYHLDVVQIPTHRPINRMDYNDMIYLDEVGKYKALAEEINNVSKTGRPVLVGTTSIEKSERLSELLTREFGVDHQVLNARPENAANEADIVAKAGQQKPLRSGSKQMVGTVTIATNMAGRGTDIKLGPGVVYPNCRVPEDEKLREMGLEPDELYPAGVNKCCIHCQQYDAATNCAHCFKPKLDETFPRRGREACPAEVPCGLHIVATERHEARRIDNQLRGRSGRQGDPGSSRFFLSVRDELITLFAPDWLPKVLAWAGMGEQGLESKRLSKGIERAQKKVENRNFERRKHLLDYDEVMDHQRKTFYAQRQDVLEGRKLENLVRDMVFEIIEEYAQDYLSRDYRARCISEWAKQALQVSVEPERIRADGLDDYEDLQADLRERTKDEARSTIAMTLGEYMDPDIPASEWDLRGLTGWAMSRFQVQLSQNQVRKMTCEQVEETLIAEAEKRIDQTDLSPLAAFLEEDFPQAGLAQWARSQFGVEVRAEELSAGVESAIATLKQRADDVYQRREVEYPAEYAMDMTLGRYGPDNVYALDALAQWANRKFEAGWSGAQLQNRKPPEIHRDLLEMSREWMHGDRLDKTVGQAVSGGDGVEQAIDFAQRRFDTRLSPEDFNGTDPREKLLQVGRNYLRREMTELERFVLLQIYDSSWKDHLLAMDHLGDSISLRAHAEQDPRVAYKREGSAMFQEMLTGIRNKVTDMIFKVRLSAEQEMTNVYQISNVVHEQLSGYDHLAQDMADQQEAAQPRKVETIRREAPKVGRNDPCPCGSGKKYKKCCGSVV
jgi:preprotein translocase subunit SecA